MVWKTQIRQGWEHLQHFSNIARRGGKTGKDQLHGDRLTLLFSKQQLQPSHTLQARSPAPHLTERRGSAQPALCSREPGFQPRPLPQSREGTFVKSAAETPRGRGKHLQSPPLSADACYSPSVPFSHNTQHPHVSARRWRR